MYLCIPILRGGSALSERWAHIPTCRDKGSSSLKLFDIFNKIYCGVVPVCRNVGFISRCVGTKVQVPLSCLTFLIRYIAGWSSW
jgi:hypothetical protein